MSEHYCIARSIICAILCMLLVSGCSAAHNTQKEPQTIGNEKIKKQKNLWQKQTMMMRKRQPIP